MADYAPKASVLLVARDAEATVSAAVASVLVQSERRWELVALDDASADGTLRALQSVKDSRVRVVRNPAPLGIAASRNRAAAEARAPVLFVADADDESMPMRLERQLAFLDANPRVMMVGSWAEAVDAEGVDLGWLRSPSSREEVRNSVAERSPLLHPTLALRREAFAAVGGYREKFAVAADLDLLFRLAERFEGAALPEPLCRYRLRPGSVSVRDPHASRDCIDAAKRFADERARSGGDGYDGWSPPSMLRSAAASDAAYHLLAGKIAAESGNLVVARRHFRSAGPAGAPLWGATLLGAGAYGLLRRTAGALS